jgi:hypothetical protein
MFRGANLPKKGQRPDFRLERSCTDFKVLTCSGVCSKVVFSKAVAWGLGSLGAVIRACCLHYMALAIKFHFVNARGV